MRNILLPPAEGSSTESSTWAIAGAIIVTGLLVVSDASESQSSPSGT